MQQTPDTIRLLIVDDDLLVRTLAAESLKACGFEVTEADDGTSGLAQIENCRPDLVLLDVMMPGVDGYEVCRTLRARPELARIPVIMLTGLDDTASIERAYECGATDFIAKPINATLLAYRVRYALRASRMLEERVAAEERIRQLADYDGLTGLANRKLFSEVMQHGLNRCTRQMAKAAVLDINLSRFKRINESLGHAVGDQVLQEAARRIAECIRASDLAGTSQDAPQASVSARMSSDGFAVFLFEIRRAEDAALIARRLINAIAQPMQCTGHELALTASIGIAVYPENGEDVSTLLRNAEAAMHGAKQGGAETFCFFTPAMNASALAKLNTESDLRRAIERDELLLFYQARVDVPAGRLAGAEALLRWQHPTRGLVPPGEFIPVAEESGLIVPLTAWVLRAACRQLQQWQRAGLAVVPVSINFSAQNFREDGLGELIAASLREFGIAPSLLEGEITESMLMQDVEGAVTRLQALRALGIELAMDDFGTGYSSLAYLKRFPLNVLKIDRAFVKDVLTDPHDAAIASTIITLGKTMGMAVVAEGMERVEQANFLLARGCTLMQGFLFARPVPADNFAQFLRSGLDMPAGLRIDRDETGTAMQPQRLVHGLDR